MLGEQITWHHGEQNIKLRNIEQQSRCSRAVCLDFFPGGACINEYTGVRRSTYIQHFATHCEKNNPHALREKYFATHYEEIGL